MDHRSLESLSIVVSIYNEENGLASFWKILSEVLVNTKLDCEVVLVNDGSTDSTSKIIQSIVDTNQHTKIRINSIELSRNFGHEAAIIAGIDYCKNEAVICLDADLQHPPELIPQMIDEYQKGYDIVNMIRQNRADGKMKNVLSLWFYKLLNTLSDFRFEPSGTDFFLISNRIAKILRENFRERNRFIRGSIQILGFNKSTLNFEAGKRIHGESKYSYKSLFLLALTALSSISIRPLYLSLIVSIVFGCLSFGLGAYSMLIYFFGDKPFSGYTTIVVFTSICFTILYFLIAILSIYIGFSFDEARDRPIYLVKNSKYT